MRKELFKMQSVIKKVDEEKREVTSVISTETEDRDKDIISAKGWDFKDYKKNPVVLWGHNYSMPPIARTMKILVDKTLGEVQATRKYPDEGKYPFADTIFNLVSGGFQNAVSVGFRPTKFIRRDALPEGHQFYVEGNPDAYFNDSGVFFQKQTLLEYSDVPIPANPEALNLAYEKGVINNTVYNELKSIPCYHCPKTAKGICTPDKDCMAVIKNSCQSKKTGNFKGWDKGFECEIEEVGEMIWNREKAIEDLKKAYDTTDKIYADAFAWCSSIAKGLGENISSKDFKLIHHYIDEKNELVVSPDGVESALKTLSDKRSKSIPTEDREMVYNHLIEHAKEFDICFDNFEMVEGDFKESMAQIESKSIQEEIKALARKLDMNESTDPPEVLAKAFDVLRTKAIIVEFASLEPAVRALEADFNTIDKTKEVDTEHKALFKKFDDILTIAKERGYVEGYVKGVKVLKVEPLIVEVKEPFVDISLVDELSHIEKALDDVVDSVGGIDTTVDEGIDKVLNDLHLKEKTPKNLKGIESALNDLDKSVQE